MNTHNSSYLEIGILGLLWAVAYLSEQIGCIESFGVLK